MEQKVDPDLEDGMLDWLRVEAQSIAPADFETYYQKAVAFTEYLVQMFPPVAINPNIMNILRGVVNNIVITDAVQVDRYRRNFMQYRKKYHKHEDSISARGIYINNIDKYLLMAGIGSLEFDEDFMNEFYTGFSTIEVAHTFIKDIILSSIIYHELTHIIHVNQLPVVIQEAFVDFIVKRYFESKNDFKAISVLTNYRKGVRNHGLDANEYISKFEKLYNRYGNDFLYTLMNNVTLRSRTEVLIYKLGRKFGVFSQDSSLHNSIQLKTQHYLNEMVHDLNYEFGTQINIDFTLE